MRLPLLLLSSWVVVFISIGSCRPSVKTIILSDEWEKERDWLSFGFENNGEDYVNPKANIQFKEIGFQGKAIVRSCSNAAYTLLVEADLQIGMQLLERYRSSNFYISYGLDGSRELFWDPNSHVSILLERQTEHVLIAKYWN